MTGPIESPRNYHVSGNKVVLSQAFTNKDSITVYHGLGFPPLVQVIDNNRVVQDAVVTHASDYDSFVVSLEVAGTGQVLYIF
ncbi:MAG: hypothetical protein ACE5EE_11495 [Fidelibacterota bacterium]